MAAHPELVEKERVEEALAEVRRKEKAVRERVLVFVRWVTAERIKLLREFEGAGEGGGGGVSVTGTGSGPGTRL